ncbi:acidic leucine-rich nuclear phosphoprotein 32-related protein-like [Phoenix dactylifera]|uniref:Acidic leucine-rich nuclear phosphoprotein 32-related protein-like n=1 Tax=Phoenix dactylifera TaxID=42345 RepID=A0A8B7BQU0_PHODC|nr:acidic leucine-rich nuclear phosphoprotein 32-related protein-like [Phoenix dactylifera]
MDEAWEKAVEAALGGRADSSSGELPRALTLDGAVKCLNGHLPRPALFEKFPALEHLSIANVRLASLESFPRLPALRRLILSDNRISGGLEFLVEAGLDGLRDLDLSNNRIQSLDYLAPLARLQLASLDLYECPVTKIKDYRSKVFGLIPSLKYLDKVDADGNERPESDEEEEDEEEDEEEYEDEEEEEEVVNGSRKGQGKVSNGVQGEEGGDEEEEDEIDEEEGEEEEDVVEEDGEEEDAEEEEVEGGEIDENEQGEDDENGEIGEDDEEEDGGTEYVFQLVSRPKDRTEGEGVDDEQANHRGNSAQPHQSSSSLPNKRKKDGEDENSMSPKHH